MAKEEPSHLEVGGALFGLETDEIAISHAVGPGPNAVRAQRFFSRDTQFTQAFADRLYLEDGSQWIGEWHTHPQGPAHPSELDLGTYAKHLDDPDLGLDWFVSVVVSPLSKTREVFTMWIVQRHAARVIATHIPHEQGAT
jgi:integrative and conjugative element protein (TIGR02256 family)